MEKTIYNRSEITQTKGFMKKIKQFLKNNNYVDFDDLKDQLKKYDKMKNTDYENIFNNFTDEEKNTILSGKTNSLETSIKTYLFKIEEEKRKIHEEKQRKIFFEDSSPSSEYSDDFSFDSS